VEKAVKVVGFLFLVLLFLRLLRLSSKKAIKMQEGSPGLRTVYQVDPSQREFLKCKYLPDHVLDGDYETYELINRRMKILQSDKAALRALVIRGRQNGWNKYQTIYNEALRGLLFEGVLEEAPEGTCQS
jgi:hypothetical protein